MIYLFDKDEKLIKIVRKSAVKTALQKYALTTERYVSDRLTVELKGLNADELEQVEYMAIQTMEDAHTFHYFYVAQKSSENLTTLIGVQSGIEELRKSPIFDKRPQNALAKDVISELLKGTNWQARFVGETSPHSTNFYYISTFDALKKVCEVWDLEMQFFVEMNGNKIGARYIDFKQKIGEAVGKRVVYGHNALQILQEVERTNIFTALIGRGKGEQTETGGYGRKLTFEDVVWSSAGGKPVDKPKGQKYLELPAMTKLYGIKNADGSMRPKIGFAEFSEEEDPEVLLERTYKALVDTARPQLTLKTSSVYLRGVKVGDTIRVVRHDKKLDYDTRIFEITFNRLNDQSSDIKLGDRVGESNEAKAQTIAEKAIDNFVANEFANLVEKLPDFLPSADGFNNNWYGAEDPAVKYPGKVLINDIWYKPDPEHEGHKIMYRWTGEAWEELMRTYASEALRDRIAEEVAKINDQMAANEAEHNAAVADLLAKAGVNQSLAEEAKRVGEAAKTDAIRAVASAQNAKSEAIAEAQRLDAAERQATTAKLATLKSEAVSEASRLVDGAKTVLGTEIASANQALRDAKTALETQVSGVRTDLTRTNDTIKTLATKTDLSALTGRVSTTETSLTQQAGQIALKANKNDVDTLAGRVGRTETSITQQAGQIALKANTSDVNSLTNRVQTAEASITTQAGQIALKANQSDVDGVKGRLNNAESSITQQANQIKQMVKTSDLEQVTGRLATAESSITQLSNRITTEITELAGYIPETVSHRNLAKGSSDEWGEYKPYKGMTTNLRHILGDVAYGDSTGVFNGSKVHLYVFAGFDEIVAVDGKTPTVKLQACAIVNGKEVWQGGPTNSKWSSNLSVGNNYRVIRVSDVVTSAMTANASHFRLDFRLDNCQSVNVRTRALMITTGDVFPDYWVKPIDDLVSDITSTKTVIQQTAEGQTQLSTRLTETAGKVTAAETRITQLVGEVGSKVSQTVFNNLKGTVDNHTTAITQANNAIALKAEKTYVDGVKSTADAAKASAADVLAKATANASNISQTKADLKVTSEAIATLVTKTDFNAATQRLSTAETSITQMAGEINKRLTSTQVEAAITGKGYQTKAQVDSNITGRGYITDAGVNNKLAGYVTATTYNNQVTETAREYNRLISETKGLIPTSINTRNLISGTDTAWRMGYGFKNTTWSESEKKTILNLRDSDANLSKNHEVLPQDSKFGSFVPQKGTQYVQSIMIDTDATFDPNGAVLFTWFTFSRGHDFQPAKIEKLGDKTYRMWGTYVWPHDGIALRAFDTQNLYRGLLYRTSGTYIKFYHPKLTVGSLPSDWEPALEDLATVTALHAVEDTVSSHTRTIADHGSSISQVVQTASGLTSRVASLTNAQNLVYDPTNYSKHRESLAGSNVALVHTDQYKLLRITQRGLTANAWKGFCMPLNTGSFVKGEKLSYRVNIWVDVVPDDILCFEIKNGGSVIATWQHTLTRTGAGQIFTGTVTVFTTTTRVDEYGLYCWLRRNGQVAVGEISIVRGDAPPTSFVDNTSRQTIATETQVSQLAGSWAVQNLTSVGTVLNQLNLNKDGSVRIDGKLVQITGTTYIQDGVIESSKIKDLDAGKITAGTLDAAKVKVINLDARSVTGLDATFLKAKIDNAIVDWLKGKVVAAQNGAMDIDLNNGKVVFKSENAALRREVTGYPTQFVKFETGRVDNKYNCGVTVIGSNRGATETTNNDKFAGVRIWNGANGTEIYDAIDVVGDRIRLVDSALSSRGWKIGTTSQDTSIQPIVRKDTSSWIGAGNFKIYDIPMDIDVLSTIKLFNSNFEILKETFGEINTLNTY